jgi:hypothetical protein
MSWSIGRPTRLILKPGGPDERFAWVRAGATPWTGWRCRRAWRSPNSWPPTKPRCSTRFGDSSDWIEICNGTSELLSNLAGWFLTVRGHEPDSMGVSQLRAGSGRLPGRVRFRQKPDSGDQRVAHQLQAVGCRQLPGACEFAEQFGVLLRPRLSTSADRYFLRRGPESCSTTSAITPRRRPGIPTTTVGERLHPEACIFPGWAEPSSARFP